MNFRPPLLDFKPAKKRLRRRIGPAFYFLLCLLVGGFLVWIFWPHGLSRPPVPIQATVVSNSPPVKAAIPIAVSKNPPPARAKPAPVAMVRPGAVPAEGTRPVATILETQIALVRLGISPGSIDGVAGGQTRSALMAFQRQQKLEETGSLDSATKAALLITSPATTEYAVTSNDLARLLPVPKGWVEKSKLPRLDFENIVELLGEKAFSSPHCIRALNPGVDWTNITAGTTVVLPSVVYPPLAAQAALIKISLRDCVLEAFDSQSNLLVHFPCSIGRLAEKRPAGELHVATVAMDPNYTFDPAVFKESAEAQAIGHKLIIPPGPNNPVGVAWIGLDKPGYGIHGTPAPEQVGRTESHGCFRLANWNADYLAKLVWIGMPVDVNN